MFFFQKFKSVLPYSNLSIQIDVECKIGDGTGGSEVDTETSFSSLKECINHVKAQYPDANGVTFQTSCTNSCKCFAEIGMTDWLTSDYSVAHYKSCRYKSGEYCMNKAWIGDGICDDQNNYLECNFDEGDCCGDNVNTNHCTECLCKV